MTSYQLIVIAVSGLWLVPLLTAWVRYDLFPHSALVFIAIFCAPLILLDDALIAFGWVNKWVFLLSVFSFIPVLIAILCFLAVQKMVKKYPPSPFLHYAVIGLLALVELPFLLVDNQLKLQMTVGLVGQLAEYWPYYSYYLLLSIAITVYAVMSVKLLKDYDNHLSEHSVDVGFYRFRVLKLVLAILVAVGVTGALTVILIATDSIYVSRWQAVLSVMHSVSLWMVMLVLVERRRFAPCPFEYSALKNKIPEAHMQAVLEKVEKTIIRYKAYRKKGLLIQHLCDAADVEPSELAISSQVLLNRNFRAFVYHYRLEYAKLLLTRTDIKVSTVARRLGFDSDKYLSDIFIKYVESMNRSNDSDMDLDD